jgi:hypothetical protein
MHGVFLLRAPLAQLDRAAGFEPVGREFESLRARQNSPTFGCKRSFAALRISPAGLDARKTAQVQIFQGAP